ncbi:MAG: retropepsin-like aspartic protease, partial [Planctomycetota bacterium]
MRTALACAAALSLAWLTGCAGMGGAEDAGPPPLSLSLSEPSAWPETVTIPLQEHKGYLFLPVRIDGKRAGLFLLDTGASLDVIATGVAGRLGLPESDRESQAVGVGGTATLKYRHIESMRFGGFQTGPREIAIVDLRPLSLHTGFTVAGILGFRTLSAAPFSIDYAEPSLILHRPDAFTRPDAPWTRYQPLGGVAAV